MWTLAVAAEFGALVPIIFGDAPVVGADVVYRLVGGSFAAFGLIAWHRRPDSRSGPLMTATGFGLLVSLLLKQIDAGVALTPARCWRTSGRPPSSRWCSRSSPAGGCSPGSTG